ncbi:MAG: flagellum-specific ATP synthase FliI [Syntrophobacteraceae bacterium CG2_30_61_12]|nr:MAG: flagellum-specific ATP synthase FliI [Syntrophobacteraceae bacterium CG2_30_61_12]
MGLHKALTGVFDCRPWRCYGKVARLVGTLIEAEGVKAALGDLCTLHSDDKTRTLYAEVVGFQDRRLKLSPLSDISGVRAGDLVEFHGRGDAVQIGQGLLGRVIDAMGRPIDGKGPIPPGQPRSLVGTVANPLERVPIRSQLDVGVRAINGLLPIGRGQRMGIFAGSGVGKSTLLGMMARYTSAAVNVIALIGERGREVVEFIDNDLGDQGLSRSVVVVATSDQPATLRMRGAFLATTIAEYFRDLGFDVLLMMDSITRFAMAGREVGLAAGEPPTTKGYTPSVFSKIPRLLERAGSFPNAAITGIYTVLVEGNDMEDPIADTMRSILDGHLVLDRGLAQRRHYPPIDVLHSISRLTDQLFDNEQKRLAARFVGILSRYKRHEDMIQIGAYVRGSNPEIDYAIDMVGKLNGYLTQAVQENASVAACREALEKLLDSRE